VIGYYERMNVTVPDEALAGIEISESEALLDIALGLFADRKATLGRAALIAGLSQAGFQKELGRRRIPIHYDVEDLEADLRTIQEL
jgi:predicted HTH domain antitoxin